MKFITKLMAIMIKAIITIIALACFFACEKPNVQPKRKRPNRNDYIDTARIRRDSIKIFIKQE